MTTRPDRLDVWFDKDVIGTLHDTLPISFEYATRWLARTQPMAIAAIALRPGRQDSIAVQAFFENLLPEGELRRYLAEQRKASTLFSLLFEVAGDTAGGFVLVPGGRKPEPPTYRATSWKKLAAELSGKSAAAIDLQGEDARISLAGAQDKASIAIFDDGVPRMPQGTSPSTHILKPDIRRLHKVWHSAVNETIIMQAAGHCGLPTAEVFYEPHTASCIVRRFDRIVEDDGVMARLMQYDLCQLGGAVSERKYEKEGGPGLATCVEMIRRYSARPAVDLRHLVGWIFFNLFVGNNDSHAKNLSLYHRPGMGVGLTPFYDLMCTRIYPGLSTEFAFQIGGEYKPGAMTSSHVAGLAKELGMRPQFLMQQASDMARRLPEAMDRAVRETAPPLAQPARLLAERLQQFVATTTRKISQRLKAR